MIFTAAATYIAGALGITSALGVAAVNLGVRVVAAAVVSSLISNRSNGNTYEQQNTTASLPPSKIAGSRVQLSPSTDNKVGVIYGDAFVAGSLIDAKISEDQQTMWYVYAIAEVTDGGQLSVGDLTSTTNTYVYWGDKTCIFGDADKSKVTKTINSNGEEDTKVDGYLNIYFYKNGYLNGVNTNGVDAITIMSDSSIVADQRWNSSRYTEAGKAPTLANTFFAIVKIKYNQDAGVVGEQPLVIQLRNTLNKPGSVLFDYLHNSRYGAGIPYDMLDQSSFDSLDTYSDELISYTNTSGGTSYQPRYRINGPLNTNETCMTNIQYLIDSCDSWLQWNEKIAKWSVVINRSYTDYTTYDDLFLIDSNNIVSGLNITPIDLNSNYNVIETQFPNSKIKDQTDYQFVYLDDADKNPHEPINKMILRYPQVNTSVQAKYLATRRMIQAREDLYVTFDMDYSGIQIDAGDVVRVRFAAYGWGPIPSNPSNPDKLFRVDQVQELKNSDGVLSVRISMFEYNNQVFENIDISDYQPAANTGITDPTIVGKPDAPTFENENIESATFDVVCTIPSPGAVIAMEFWYGPTPTIINNNYILWDTQFNSTTPVYTAGAQERTTVVGFHPGTYYWAVRAVTQTTKSQFSNATSQSWDPAQPASRKTCSQITTQEIIYSDLYKLWSPDTRGSTLMCEYIPSADGKDAGGKSTNEIEINFDQTIYTSGGSTGLLSEVWSAIDIGGSYNQQHLGYGANGFLLLVSDASYSTGFFTGNMEGDQSANPDTYITNTVSVPISDLLYASTGNSSGVYVAVGLNGTVTYSATGYGNGTWYAANIPVNAQSMNFRDVIYEEGIFIAIGGTSSIRYIMTSTDGANWTERVYTTSSRPLYGIAYDGTRFMATGPGFWIGTSSDGISWSFAQISGGSTYYPYGITYIDYYDRWCVVGYSGTPGVSQTPFIAISSDYGSTWTETYTGPSSGTSLIRRVASNYDVYSDTFAVGYNGLILYSDDGGSNWSLQAVPNNNYTGVFKYNNAFYITNSSGAQMYTWPISTSSIQWELINLWDTFRVWNYGSSPNSAYDLTIQPPENQLPNNVPIGATFTTGAYFANTPVRYILVGGDLNNPSTPHTLYSSRKTISITEYKG